MEQPPQNVTVLDGKDSIITCRAVGAPTPNITWIYNGKTDKARASSPPAPPKSHMCIPSNHTLFVPALCVCVCVCVIVFCMLCVCVRTPSDSVPVEYSGRVQVLDSGDLLISNVRESDAGSYECQRSNEAGTVSGKGYLSVMGELFVVF